MVTRNDKTFCDMYEEWKMNQVHQQQKEYYDSLEKKGKDAFGIPCGEFSDDVTKAREDFYAFMDGLNKKAAEKMNEELDDLDREIEAWSERTIREAEEKMNSSKINKQHYNDSLKAPAFSVKFKNGRYETDNDVEKAILSGFGKSLFDEEPKKYSDDIYSTKDFTIKDHETVAENTSPKICIVYGDIEEQFKSRMEAIKTLNEEKKDESWYKQEFTTNDDGTASVKNTTTEYDGKTTPSYYIGKHKQITAADVVADFGLSYNVGNAVVYLLRAGKKPNNPYLQDLIKAVHHLNMEIEQHNK